MISSRPITQAERLARIETLLDEQVIPIIKRLDAKVDADVADLARLKNRGAGILVGVAIAFTSLGALLRPKLESLMALFH